ncbi:fatty-acid amide hydrolase 2-like isoform X2 [Parasteatoda tepidariorum]|uniref:fatty-acid amide hydrolase 2-like isoform X2 n=1 Tax=Parasteatoda tepidariorum TaxID=114398 RepID=UPI001C726739|nr:fatty-acid amide hydrolase 2-like isoform X2 [Parasteatoda tepidariorum]
MGIKSVDVVKAYIERIRQVHPIVNAIVDDRFSEAIEEARYIDESLKESNKTEDEIARETPFLGVPVTIKECIAVKGCLYTVGLPARKGVRATFDADVVHQMKQAGAIPIAVTITPELCLWWESYNTLYGYCSNPYDTTRTAGGSSGGEGCILGSAGSVIGIGNDIGGSIRIPAAFNGVFGHKPTRGIVSNTGHYPTPAPSLQTFLMTGPMCRYASDLLPMTKVLAGNNSSKLKLDEKVNFREMKIYYMENEGGNPLVSAVNPEIINAQKKVMEYFRDTYGIAPTKVQIPNMHHSFVMWSKVITTSGFKPITYEMTNRRGHADLFVEVFKWLIGVSDHIFPALLSAAVNKIWVPKDEKKASKYYEMMQNMEQHFENFLGEDGIFIYPTGSDLAPFHGQPVLKPFNVSYTCVFNLLGLPVTQCPVTLSRDGIPVGLQIVSGLYNDHLTIAVAEEIEKYFGGWVCPASEAFS